MFARPPVTPAPSLQKRGSSGPSPAARGTPSVPRRCQVSPGGAERPSRDSPLPACSASGGCMVSSFTLGAPAPWWPPGRAHTGPPARGRAWLDLSNSGVFAGLRPPSRVSLQCPSPVSLPRSSGREGGVSGVGGRELYKSAGGCLARASLAASRRDWERCAKHGQWRGRCARATQCMDYLQPLLMQYAGAPEQLNGVATPLPGLDHSAAFPYEEDTSE